MGLRRKGFWSDAARIAACLISLCAGQRSVAAVLDTKATNRGSGSVISTTGDAHATNQPPDLKSMRGIEAFKNFVANPPVIREIVFIKTLSADRLKPVQRIVNGKTELVQPYVPPLIHARWQPSAFYYRDLSGVADLENQRLHGYFAGYFNKDHWDCMGTNIAFLWTRTAQETELSFVGRSVRERLESVAEVLNMGPHGADIGSLRWSGNHLQGHAMIERRMNVEGDLLPGADGRVEHMTVRYSAPSELTDYLFRYVYDAALSVPHLPNRIRTSIVKDGQETFLHEIRVFKLETQESSLPKELFDPSAMLETNRVRTLTVRGDGLYETNGAGAFVFVSKITGNSPPRLLIYRDAIRMTFIGAAIAFNALIFILVLRMDKQQTINPKGIIP